MEGWKPLATQARIAQVAEPNARRYVSAFPQFFPARKMGKALVYGPDTVEILKVIADAFAQKKVRGEVEEILAGLFIRTHDVEPSAPTLDRQSSAPALPDTLAALLPLAERFVIALEAQTKALQDIARALADDRGSVGKGGQEGQQRPIRDASRSDIIERVMSLYREGLGCQAISSRMRAEYWPTLSGKPGHRWWKSTVRRIVSVNLYTGDRNG